MAIGIMTQGKVGMRPSEMLGLVTSDLVFPEESGYPRGVGPLIIGLGTRANTKAKRPQANSIMEQSSPVLVDLLRFLRNHTAPGSKLFPYSLERYRRTLSEIQEQNHLALGWTPHSVRAGFASEASAWGMSFEQIRDCLLYTSPSPRD